jgi:hypothetical protein
MGMPKDRPTSLIRPGDRPEKNGEGTVYDIPKDLITMMSDEIKDPAYVDGPVNECRECGCVIEAGDYCRPCETRLSEMIDSDEPVSFTVLIERMEHEAGRIGLPEEVLEEGVGYPMEAVLSGKPEICFEDGMQVPLDDAARRALREHYDGLDGRSRRELGKFVRRSYGNFCRTLSLL